MSYNKLPADPTAMILGVIALVVSFAGCCCGLFAVIPLVLSIIGLVMSNKSLRLFNENQDIYAVQSRSNVTTARVINIVALVLSALITVIYVAYFVLYGALLSTAFMEGYNDSNTFDEDFYEWENDSIYDYDDFEIEEDTLQIDSIISEPLNESLE
ncbi:CCC motif membrane protein [uncultured Psychroserpens sp.]|uniref:CCC motif membrane protein n=1 Tax=uncultured Psychroserpens sp. TaxID=255436 RepID=UPI00262CCADC|nr:CCC motif membrane protein [uncultured Psychroserpens sp.]